MIALTARVRLKNGARGEVRGVYYTFPVPLLDLCMADGTILKGVPETEISEVLEGARPDLVRHVFPHSPPSAAPQRTAGFFSRFGRGRAMKPKRYMVPR